MESSLEFRVEDLLQRTEIYSVKKYDYTVDKLPFSKFHKLSKESNELITKVTFPEFKHQQKNVKHTHLF